MDGLTFVALVVEGSLRNLGPASLLVITLDRGGVVLGAHPQGIILDIAVDTRTVLLGVARVIGKAFERRRPTQVDDELMGHARLSIQGLTGIILVLGVPNRARIVVNQALRQTVASALANLFFGVGSRGPSSLVDRLLTSSVLLGALNNELFAISARSQLGVSALIVNLERRQLFVGDREGTGDCIVANGDLLTIHIRECIPPPLYPLGSAKAAIGSDDTVITTVIAPIAQRFSHGLLICLLSCCVASI